MKKNWIFIILLSMAALSLAGTAAYFSVYGLTKLFAAAGIGITILAASLEFAKLVTVSYVYRFWKNIKKGLRFFYIFAVVFIMLLTSVGIYGFLTGAYQQSANKIQLRDAHIQIYDNKRKLFTGQLDRINKSIQSSNDRINTLSGIRSQQENRLDNLYNQNYVTVAKRTETQITGSDDQIKLLNNDITDKMHQTNVINDSIGFYDQKIAELNNSDVSNEIGPYKFVADLTGLPVGKIVNFVAILIILVFDPLAIALLIGVNQLTLVNSPLYDSEESSERNNIFARFFRKKKKEDETETNTEEFSVKTEESNDEIKPDEDKEVTNYQEMYLIPDVSEIVKDETINDDNLIEQSKFSEPALIFKPIIEIEQSSDEIKEVVEEVVEQVYEPIIEEVIQPVEEKFAEFVINSEVKPVDEKTDELVINSEVKTVIDENKITDEVTTDENVKSFLDVFENDEYQARRIASVKGRINVAHFVPKE